jgi:DtxR family transcriptional regulator, Mn-dependent transcriptional regulator
MPASGEHHPAFEEYCECIFELHEDDVDVIQARIAERLQVSRPAVSEMMKRLEAEGLITSDGGIRLTDSGRRLGERVVRRHRLAEVFLTDVLKLSWAEAHHEAGKWEHVMSDSVEAALNELLGSPTTCPHGNPIPGSGYEAPDSGPLSEVDVGSPFTVRRITEELEFEPGLLEFLEESAIQPGNRGTVTAASPDGTVTVEIDGRHIGVGPFASERILVTPDPRLPLADRDFSTPSCPTHRPRPDRRALHLVRRHRRRTRVPTSGEVNVDGSFETLPTTTLPISRIHR